MTNVIIKRWYNKYNYYEISRTEGTPLIHNIYITYDKGCSQIDISPMYFKDIRYKEELTKRLGRTLYNKILKDINKLNI